MCPRRRFMSGLLAAVLTPTLLTGIAGPGPARATPAPLGATPGTSAAPSRLTLITGDTVIVHASGGVTFTPAAGHDDDFVSYRQADGHLFVIPVDAMRLVDSNKLDRTLFDTTALASYGYDTERGDLPLLVKPARNAKAAAREAITRGRARVTRDLSRTGFVAVRSDHDDAPALWDEITAPAARGRTLRSAIGQVWLDRPVRVNLDHSVPQVAAPQAWAAGYDGTGTTVAVLDTGIDATHPDLAGKVLAAQNFTIEPDATDQHGHGTHVASTIAGTGAQSGGAYRGVAPGATLLNGKVCIATTACAWSWMLAGMEWATQQGADVVNMSIGGPDTEGVDPVEEAVNTLTASTDTLFVISAGNTPGAAGDYSVSSPGTADAAVSVGAVDDADQLAAFSNRGPRVGDTALKPDLTAPGVAVMAARSSTGIMGDPGDSYTQMNGTSMAAPHVAGAAAILHQSRPDWAPAQLKAALLGAADPNADLPAFHQGAGRLNVGRAYQATVLADPPSVSLGRQLWPHEDDPVLTRTVSYTNTGTSPVTLDLSLTTRAPDGSPAPEGMFTVSPATLDLPPGGTAEAVLTATTAVDGPVGLFGGHLTARAGDLQVTTAYAIDRADEGYEITMEFLNRAGGTPYYHSAIMLPLGPGRAYQWSTYGGAPTQFVLKGTYFVQAYIYESQDATEVVTTMVYPRLEVTEDRLVTFDARAAGEVDLGISDDSLEQLYAVEVSSQMSQDGYMVSNTGMYTGRTFIGQVVPDERVPGYLSKVHAMLIRPGPVDAWRNPPRSYHLGRVFDEVLPQAWTEQFSTGSLGRVDVSIGGNVPGSFGRKGAFAFSADGRLGTASASMPTFDPPATHTEYYNSGNVVWQPIYQDMAADGSFLLSLDGGMEIHPAGTTVAQAWNRPVFGPAHTMPPYPVEFLVRSGDTIAVNPKLFSDSAGHAGHPWLLSSGQLVLRRDGVTVGTHQYPDFPAFDVPGGYARYELEVTAERGEPVELSTKVQSLWTFWSDTTGGSAWVRLPIWSVSFRPGLDAANTARAGVRFTMPATVAAQPGSTAAGLRTVTVQYSVNDGATWTNATVTGSGGTRWVTVTHPRITGFVSLRATASDYAGNSVVQTILRAYKIAP